MPRANQKAPSELTPAEKARVGEYVQEFLMTSNPTSPANLKLLAGFIHAWHPDTNVGQLILDYLTGPEFAAKREQWNETMKRVREHSARNATPPWEVRRQQNQAFNKLWREQRQEAKRKADINWQSSTDSPAHSPDEHRRKVDLFDWWRRELDMRYKKFLMKHDAESLRLFLIQLEQYKTHADAGSLVIPRYSVT